MSGISYVLSKGNYRVTLVVTLQAKQSDILASLNIKLGALIV